MIPYNRSKEDGKGQDKRFDPGNSLEGDCRVFTAGNRRKSVQLFYTLADSMIVGRTLGADALAAVGATATIVYFVLCFIQGLTGGCGILLGQAFGAGNEKQVRESVSASVWISALFTIVLTVLCCSMVHPILRMLNTPVDIYDRTYTYLFIIFLGNGATVFL